MKQSYDKMKMNPVCLFDLTRTAHACSITEDQPFDSIGVLARPVYVCIHSTLTLSTSRL